ncbi:MAG: large conductance mechanosensitive channel protein MscL [Oscillospiraceae bacterium]|nr:large conductance mechanosensitive channel protein MscL [Oscillospiraceae bacterium]MCD8255033.1 large conductance mechanosensitive channel protein MscL [Oscillospiraceae bacterium]
MKNFVKEFRDFIMRGNVLDMAVGVIIATAFSSITTSLINDVFMPFIGWIIGDIDLAALNIELSPAVMEGGEVVTEAVVIGIGTFISAIINFILVALVVFFIVKGFNKAHEMSEKKKKAEEAAAPAEPAGPTTEQLLAEILEELKSKNK